MALLAFQIKYCRGGFPRPSEIVGDGAEGVCYTQKHPFMGVFYYTGLLQFFLFYKHNAQLRTRRRCCAQDNI